jgi:hypothetical protein
VRFRDGSTTALTATFTVAGPASHGLMVSTSDDRSSPTALEGATLSGHRYVFLGPSGDAIAGLKTLRFLIDGRFVGADVQAPYDLYRTKKGGAPVALDTRGLRNGEHDITAIVVLEGGATLTYSAAFRVAN